MIFEFPTEEEWKEIAQSFPPTRLKIDINDFYINGKGINNFKRHITTMPWVHHLTKKLSGIYISYVFSAYYYRKGIPDDEWFMIDENGSITYYPHFNILIHLIKSQFDYYSDSFYHNYFSALDIIGHILNEMLELNLKISEVTFDKALKKAKIFKPKICEQIEKEKSKKNLKSQDNSEIILPINSLLAILDLDILKKIIVLASELGIIQPQKK